MCTANRQFGIIILVFCLLSCVVGALRGTEEPASGKTPPQSPGSSWSLSSSGEHLATWTRLSGKFEQTLNRHEQTLSELSGRLRTSERNGTRLNDLLTQLSRQNDDLKAYNGQIGERMQERDEELSRAYEHTIKLEKRFLKAVIGMVVMGLIIAGAVIYKVCKFFRLI
jgi:hypothetical protein